LNTASLTPGQQLRKDIETCELPHQMFAALAKTVTGWIEDALTGFDPKGCRVPGPSGVGKSSLIARMARAYPHTRINGRLQASVLIVQVPQFATAKQLPVSVLQALGLKVPPRMTAEAVFALMKLQLQLAGTRFLIFDEISHLVDEGSRVPPRAASDWFKRLLDEAHVGFVGFGIPRLERLFAANEQLRRRSRPARDFLPYDATAAKEMQAYVACVSSYARLFEAAGYPIAIPARTLAQQTYLLSGGLIGVLADFMRELARQVASNAPRTLTYADCQAALEDVSHAGSPHLLAFQDGGEGIEVSPAALKQAYIHVLQSNAASVPVRKK
jgi:hypothetical protein